MDQRGHRQELQLDRDPDGRGRGRHAAGADTAAHPPRRGGASRPGGVLFLGSSETPDSAPDLFDPLDKAAHLYRRSDVPSPTLFLPISRPHPAPAGAEAPVGTTIERSNEVADEVRGYFDALAAGVVPELLAAA